MRFGSCLANGVTGDATVRAYAAAFPGFAPGQAWLDLKASIENATGSTSTRS